MKYRRKPVSRDVVDAIFDAQAQQYIYDRLGNIFNVPKDAFEADYEPVKRERGAKPKRAKKEKVAT